MDEHRQHNVEDAGVVDEDGQSDVLAAAAAAGCTSALCPESETDRAIEAPPPAIIIPPHTRSI